MLQQAIPNWSMNIEEPRTQFMNESNFVRMNGEEPNVSRSLELNRSVGAAAHPRLLGRLYVRGLGLVVAAHCRVRWVFGCSLRTHSTAPLRHAHASPSTSTPMNTNIGPSAETSPNSATASR